MINNECCNPTQPILSERGLDADANLFAARRTHCSIINCCILHNVVIVADKELARCRSRTR